MAAGVICFHTLCASATEDGCCLLARGRVLLSSRPRAPLSSFPPPHHTANTFASLVCVIRTHARWMYILVHTFQWCVIARRLESRRPHLAQTPDDDDDDAMSVAARNRVPRPYALSQSCALLPLTTSRGRYGRSLPYPPLRRC